MQATANTPDTPIQEQSVFTKRQQRLGKLLAGSGLTSLVLNPGPSLAYLTGLNFHLMERPVLALFSPAQPVTLVMPELEAAKTASLPFSTQVLLYGEDPLTWPAIFKQAAQIFNLEGQVGVEPTRLRFLELRLLEQSAPFVSFVSGENLLAEMRMRKDVDELARMRQAVAIAQLALKNSLPLARFGMSERELAAELTLQLLRAGSDAEMPFSPIVSNGPNSANPHASPSERTLQPGDLLVIDWGASYQGYCSDLTRTFAIGDVRAELQIIGQIVLEANQAGREAARPGVPASLVDAAARNVIEKAGYGKFFTHRTGHGLGMEGHEAPYLRAGNSMVLEPGMTFTVEPGIYLPGDNGVRIEDNVVITENGSETLSNLPRELITLGGSS